MPPDFFWPQRDKLIVHRYCEMADKLVLCRRVQTKTGWKVGIGPKLAKLQPP